MTDSKLKPTASTDKPQTPDNLNSANNASSPDNAPSSNNAPSAQKSEPVDSHDTTNYIATYTQRAAAFLIDGIIIGAFGFLLGTVCSDIFVQLGAAGPIIGFLIALSYFTYADSHLADGQSLGKRVLGIKVIKRSGQLLSVPISALRYVIIGLPFSLNGALLPSSFFVKFQTILVGMLIFGTLLTTLYLVIFNRQRRQLLPDILVDTLVVHAKAKYQPIPPTPIKALKVSAVLFIIVGVFGFLSDNAIQDTSMAAILEELQSIQATVESDPAIQHVQVNTNVNTTITGEQKTKTYALSLRIYLNNKQITDEALARRLAQMAVANYSETNQLDVVIVNLVYGYNIGIASVWQSEVYHFQPSELIDQHATNHLLHEVKTTSAN